MDQSTEEPGLDSNVEDNGSVVADTQQIDAPEIPLPPAVDFEEEEEETTSALSLRLHNEYRKKHDAPPMTLNHELCKLAEDYARAHIRGTKVKLDEAKMGLNIFKVDHFSEAGMNTDIDAAKESVIAWYSANKNYDWEDPSKSPEDTKTFQEIVWKGTKNLGVGVVIGKDGIYAVTLYSRNRDVSIENLLQDNISKATE